VDDLSVDNWPSKHFSLPNPVDDRPTDLAYLIRRVAEELERRGIEPIDLLDLTVSS
jgi:hypothetical protein